MNLMDVLVPERLASAVISHLFQVKDLTANIDSPLNYISSTNPVAESWKMKLDLVWTAAVTHSNALTYSPGWKPPLRSPAEEEPFYMSTWKHNTHVDGHVESSAKVIQCIYHSISAGSTVIPSCLYLRACCSLLTVLYYSCMPIYYLCADLYMLV